MLLKTLSHITAAELGDIGPTEPQRRVPRRIDWPGPSSPVPSTGLLADPACIPEPDRPEIRRARGGISLEDIHGINYRLCVYCVQPQNMQYACSTPSNERKHFGLVSVLTYILNPRWGDAGSSNKG